MDITKSRASEGSHWYTTNGEPMYQVPRAKGDGMRPTTLRDAKKYGNLVPSVTTVLKVVDKPFLTTWRENQAILATLTHPRRKEYEDGGLGEDDFLKLVRNDAHAQASQAAELGSRIHEAFHQKAIGEAHSTEMTTWAVAIEDGVDNIARERDWLYEQAFANGKLWYGGKVDLYSRGSGSQPAILVDIKSKEFSQEDNVKPYPEQVMQLAAYAVGLGLTDDTQGFTNVRLVNLYVSRTNPGLVKHHEYTVVEGEKAWEKFKLLLKFWQIDRGLGPGGKQWN